MDIREFISQKDQSAEYFEMIINKMREAQLLALFGAGQGGIRTLEFIKRHELCERVFCFIDNNPRKWGLSIQEIPILSLHEFQREIEGKYLIIVSCGEGDEIKKQCIENGVPAEKILIPDLTLLDVIGADYCFIWNHIVEFDALFQMLEDERSRQTLVNILNYKITRNMELLKQICNDANDQYFDRNLINFDGTETFVDCGAYTGDTVTTLIKKFSFSSGYLYCFEADNDNYTILKEQVAKLTKRGNIGGRCFNFAVWNRTDSLHFNAVGSGSGFVGESGNIRVLAKSLDETLKNVHIDFIKMDIEGAEVNALIGAYQIIQENHPILAISVYHKPEHLFQIPMLIKAFAPEYKLYLRHYRECSVSETICYAIPNNGSKNE